MTYIFPAIDLMGGECVRLHKGRFDEKTSYSTQPVEIARQFESQGADWLHVVDLDGARDETRKHAKLVGQIVRETGLRVQSGGGIRTREAVEAMLNEGVERVVIGSLAVTEPETVRAWMDELGPRRIVLALDVQPVDGVYRPAVKGWTEVTEHSLWDVMGWFPDLATVLITDISRDGVLGGGNVALYADVTSRVPDVDLITSGGVGSLDDVKALKALNPHGVIIGKAIYENKFTLSEAIAC